MQKIDDRGQATEGVVVKESAVVRKVLEELKPVLQTIKTLIEDERGLAYVKQNAQASGDMVETIERQLEDKEQEGFYNVELASKLWSNFTKSASAITSVFDQMKDDLIEATKIKGFPLPLDLQKKIKSLATPMSDTKTNLSDIVNHFAMRLPEDEDKKDIK